MRIAICFSGQLRTAIEASKNLIRYFGFLYDYCDFFIHTWDNNQQKVYNLSNIFPENVILNNDFFDKVNEIYSPKKLMIENYNEVYQRESKLNSDESRDYFFERSSPLWYSFMKSIELKKQYEIENNFRYDYVVKLRPDIIFPPERKMSFEFEGINIRNNEVFIENKSDFDEYNKEFMDDVYFIGNSISMGIFSGYYEYMINNYMTVYYYLKLNNINLSSYIKHSYFENSYSILRPECLEYLDDYYKCKECDGYYYAFGPGTEDIYGISYLYIDYLKDNYDFDPNKKYTIDEILNSKKIDKL
jgi:hypothetical protein